MSKLFLILFSVIFVFSFLKTFDKLNYFFKTKKFISYLALDAYNIKTKKVANIIKSIYQENREMSFYIYQLFLEKKRISLLEIIKIIEKGEKFV